MDFKFAIVHLWQGTMASELCTTQCRERSWRPLMENIVGTSDYDIWLCPKNRTCTKNIAQIAAVSTNQASTVCGR